MGPLEEEEEEEDKEVEEVEGAGLWGMVSVGFLKVRNGAMRKGRVSLWD